MKIRKKVQDIVKNFFFPDEIMLRLPTEEKRKRIYVFTVIAVSVPVLLGFGIMHFHMDGWLQSSWANFAIAGLLTAIVLIARKAKDDKGYWQAVEQYISTHTDALFSHGICEDCLKKSEPEIYQNLVDKGKIKPVKD